MSKGEKAAMKRIIELVKFYSYPVVTNSAILFESLHENAQRIVIAFINIFASAKKLDHDIIVAPSEGYSVIMW